jgi:ParB family chromosome partitioning protein
MRLDPARYTAQELAAKTGKSVTFVLQRLKLADLIPAAARSFQKDEIATGHALLLARLSPAQQEEAFPHCFADVWLEGKQKKRLVNVAEFSHYIDNNIVLELSEAPFSREDENLHPEAGACLNCPKRSGFNTLLFPDVKKDSCMLRSGLLWREAHPLYRRFKPCQTCRRPPVRAPRLSRRAPVEIHRLEAR